MLARSTNLRASDHRSAVGYNTQKLSDYNSFHASNDDQSISISPMIMAPPELPSCSPQRSPTRQSLLLLSQAATINLDRLHTNFNRGIEPHYGNKALISTIKHFSNKNNFSKANTKFRLRNWVRQGSLILQINNSTKVKEYKKWH